MWCANCDTFHDAPLCASARKRKRYSSAFRKLKDLIFERDRVCLGCGVAEHVEYNAQGKTKPRLVVHHIDEDSGNNIASNLATLCVDCHNTHHKGAYSPFVRLADDAAARTCAMATSWVERYIEVLSNG